MTTERAFDIAFDTAQRMLSVQTRREALKHVEEQMRTHPEFWGQVREYLKALPSSQRFHGAAHMDRFDAFDKKCTKCGRSITEQEWQKELRLIGFQVVPAWQDEPGEVLELRNDICGSTLARLAPFSPEALEKGADVEIAKTGDLRRAQSVAADRLYVDPSYYDGL